MRITCTMFQKQAKDMTKNPGMLVMFAIFPAVALIMTQLIAKQNPDIPSSMFTTMMAGIFAGMALITSVAQFISEDIEHKRLRLLVMAGVKPHQYLTGLGGFILTLGIIVSIVFALIGEFRGEDLWKFLAVMIMSTAASIILGAAIGILTGNQQMAVALGFPVSMVIGFLPMIASFNERIERVTSFIYTLQLNAIVNDFSANFQKAMIVISSNIVVFIILFVIAYKMKGLKG